VRAVSGGIALADATGVSLVRQSDRWRDIVPNMAATRPIGFEEIWRAELTRLLNRLLGIRRVAQPLVVGCLVYIVATDEHWWRAAILATIGVLALVATVVEMRRMRARPGPRTTSAFDVTLATVSITALCMLTGGVHSPFLPQALVVSLLVPLIYRGRPATSGVFAMVILIWTLFLLRDRAPWMMPSVFLDHEGRLTPRYDLTWALLFTAFAFVSGVFGLRLRQMSEEMLQRSLEARDELLRSHGERLHELTTLSGEIAHELKNPLASVKGLVHLVEADPQKAPERLRVLRGEVDRMQAILDEFLNFSRPLVPLSQQRVDVSALAAGVLELHEGVAREHGLSLKPPDGVPLLVRCDPRKVKQMLINLVQNAIDASPVGGEVGIDVERVRDQAIIRVLDRGSGILPELGDRLFEPGVTSKARGSGLGLTIVRALAEQHDGSVRVHDRDDGPGCVAELHLPIAGTPPATEERA
jgi:signal transduction histidine kinase